MDSIAPEKLVEISDLLWSYFKVAEHEACGVDSYSMHQRTEDCFNGELYNGDGNPITLEWDMEDEFIIPDASARLIGYAMELQRYVKRQVNGEDAVAKIKEEYYLEP